MTYFFSHLLHINGCFQTTNEPKLLKSTSGKLRGHDFIAEDDRIATNPRAMNRKKSSVHKRWLKRKLLQLQLQFRIYNPAQPRELTLPLSHFINEGGKKDSRLEQKLQTNT